KATSAQLIDNDGQRGDSLAAVAAAVMKQNNVSGIGLLKHGIDNFLRRDLLAVGLAPVVRINFLADDEVTHILGDGKLRHFFCVFRLMVNAIRRAEENGFYVERAFDQTLGEIELPP